VSVIYYYYYYYYYYFSCCCQYNEQGGRGEILPMLSIMMTTLFTIIPTSS